MAGLLSAWRAWSERREILREVRRQGADNREQLRFKVKDKLTFALEALERADNKYAAALWEELMEQHPAIAHDSPLALRVLVGLRRFDEAEAMILAGQKKHPGDPYFAKSLGEIAHTKCDYDTAAERWAFLRKRFPGVAEGYTYGASAFLQKGQPQQAEALALEAIKRFPDHIGGPLEYARIAVTAQNWEQALERWMLVLSQFEYFEAYVGSAQALTHLGRYDEAEELLQKARIRFGTHPGPLSEFARVAETKGDIPAAVQRWKAVLDRFPLDMGVHLNASAAFERLGAPAEAEATLRAAVDRFPTDIRPLTELARLLHLRRHEFVAAAEAWAAIRRIFPDNAEAYIRGAEVLRSAGHAEEADSMLKAFKSRSAQAT